MRLAPRRDGNPRPFFLGLLALTLLATAGGMLLLAWETPEALPLLLALALLELPILIGLFLWLSRLPQELYYELQGPTLTVHFPFGKRLVHRSQVAEVRPIAYALPWWTRRGESAMPGYHRRRWRLGGKPVEVYVGARRGEGVLLVLKSGEGLLLNPEDPKPLLRWKEEA
ncbi:hypothetical protein [Thermus igniterrae]|uniref:hypothetical protein n=1 Tax=Thermus igniterrae TaxID=88189 RepID=UPI00037929C1|nr:hypothetical protein [Thermus igniterrae]